MRNSHGVGKSLERQCTTGRLAKHESQTWHEVQIERNGAALDRGRSCICRIFSSDCRQNENMSAAQSECERESPALGVKGTYRPIRAAVLDRRPSLGVVYTVPRTLARLPHHTVLYH